MGVDREIHRDPEHRCHWHRDADGNTTLIPGCWSRVHDPDAECLCGTWSEETARETITALKAKITLLCVEQQRLVAALRAVGVSEHPSLFDPAAHTARRRWKAMHKFISEMGETR